MEVALGTVFDAPVLSALAERLEAENTAVLPPIPLAPRDGKSRCRWRSDGYGS
ncbi:hypothetical protein AAFM48_22250 [Burkholderia pseudomallei]